MIHSIIDSDGLLIYSGNINNEKFISLKDNSDYSVIESCPSYPTRKDGFIQKIKWDGNAWVEVPISDTEKWVKSMKVSDYSLMNRTQEEILGKIGTDGFPDETKKKYDDKVALRATKP